MRSIFLLALIIAFTSVQAAPKARPKPEPAFIAPDEQSIDSTIDDLGAADFKIRKAATDKLAGYGPEVVPLLQKHRQHDDPEVRARVNTVIKSFGWMRQGAIVTYVTRNSQADKLGVRLGDVVVKIDDVDVNTHVEVGAVREGRAATLFLWRGGELLKVHSKPGTFGIHTSNWDIAKGGNDHSRGLGFLNGTKPDYEQAYRRLLAACEQGMDDKNTMGVLAALAARALDHEEAVRFYGLFGGARLNCIETHAMEQTTVPELPYSSPHSQMLFDRYHNEPNTVWLAHELEDWFARYGRNKPMLMEILARPWPAQQWIPGATDYHLKSRMLLALDERRYADVLADWPGDDKDEAAYGWMKIYMLQAAVRSGKTQDAAKMAKLMWSDAIFADHYVPRPALWGLAVAAALDDQASVDSIFKHLEAHEKSLGLIQSLRSIESLSHPAAGAALRKWLDRRPRSQTVGRFQQIALAHLIADPTATEKQFDDFTQGYDPSKLAPAATLTLLTGTLRFGQHDRSNAVLAAMAKRPSDEFKFAREATARVIRFAQQNKARLTGDWKELQGIIQIADAPKEGLRWALRYDGQVFRIEKNNTAKRFEGLTIPPAPVSVGYSHLLLRPGGVLVLMPYGRYRLADAGPLESAVISVFDGGQQRWVSFAEWDKPHDFESRVEVVRAAADRLVAKAYPALRDGQPRSSARVADDFILYEGDILIHVDPDTYKLRDLSAEIGRLSGRGESAKLYHPQKTSDGRYLVFSECGLWLLEATGGKVSQIKLGLADENVITCSLPPQQYGKVGEQLLIGVAPQQGGQIVEVNLQTGQSTITKGFCGLGPDDWYASHIDKWDIDDPQILIHAMYLKRLNKK